ncbi:MAG: hypothetical protein COY38_03020 [Candidatus Aenigmarchaeota archaeon CG_4_10_14_0_8_um_filter_37_24]|nr:hypothetical protein [Candidatus Aenigmarchaeota archaeon]OIN87159.1 MAG: hypothetical protein AUJ50_03240 [Candidatus Aenigmarchaeota archaeon CG1_02_38_14]PIV69611.1 MAG: hypothetical protein COS07_00135 [Candidatus Aenigmarchaeota archaeon CG01_land_8_20_14_3_00_37_9]PIX51107.1 MAG: hypothetical protein COZ52_00925 [Candidatus Aenigmarchaeota archaeon CG_4_8_14_3_um_filter_37_24]PIY35447.1 MAG: hypothetical protein COZ04_03510 [Candidatus Aenigmarchaeota archaeon CG_4_10_14_3_um_filter_37
MIKMALTIIFDTNIYLDFLLIEDKKDSKESIPKYLKQSNDIYDLIPKRKFKVIHSIWNEFELRDQISKLNLERKFIMHGFSVPEFGKAKEIIVLNENDKNAIDDAALSLLEISKHEEVELNMNEILKMVRKGLSFMDSILVFQAEYNKNCDYLVTRDNTLRKQVNEFKFSEKVIGGKTFLSKI